MILSLFSLSSQSLCAGQCKLETRTRMQANFIRKGKLLTVAIKVPKLFGKVTKGKVILGSLVVPIN